MHRPPALAFLDDILSPTELRLRRAAFLQSGFEENNWRCAFGKSGTFQLDFGICLPSGLRLTQNGQLLSVFKYWLTASAHDFQGAGYSLAHQYAMVNATAMWQDYLLLHATEFNLEERGLRALTRDRIRGILEVMTSQRLRQEAIYDWSGRISVFIQDGLRHADYGQLERILDEHPLLRAIDDEQECCNSLSLEIRDIPKARAWLYLNGLYERDSKLGYRYSLKSSRVAAVLYRDTLRGALGRKSKPAILNADPFHLSVREYPMVPTSTKGHPSRVTSDSAHYYVTALEALEALRSIPEVREILPPNNVLDSLDDHETSRQEGRFTTLPADVAFKALREAIEFHLKYGTALASSISALLRASKSEGLSIPWLPAERFLAALDPAIRDMGVEYWAVPRRKRLKAGTYAPITTRSDRFELIREHKGLFELLDVYYGAVQVVVGTLMARRQGELIDLEAGSVLDTSDSFMLFQVEKSGRGLRGIRREEALPIASIGAEMIRELEGIQEVLIECGFAGSYQPLFSRISKSGSPRFLSLSHHHFNSALDAFCDYIETPVVDGKRYYLRQHLLRRFFAMMFFWTHSFGGLETLRWFFGHRDVEQIYRYITESTPGAVLRGVQAGYAAQNVNSYEELAQLLKERYGIADFTILDDDELESHISTLIQEGIVSVEPKFFTGPDGKDFKVMVVVRGDKS